MRFELSRLRSYDDESILEELKRVATLIPLEQPYTTSAFDKHAKVHSTTVTGRFGGWQKALVAAGLAHRYSGRTVSAKMRKQAARDMSDEDLLAELRRVARLLSTGTLTIVQFDAHSHISASAIRGRFGSWNKGLQAAGLRATTHGRRYTQEEYFENLLAVWTHFGRQPTYAEMDHLPSCIGSGAYEKRWGTWTKALLAFLERVNSDVASGPPSEPGVSSAGSGPRRAKRRRGPGSTPIGVRYNILRRDRFKCVLCGNSPATDPLGKLHVDHITPVARGGGSEAANLRSLCEKCNLGKRDKSEDQPNRHLM